MWTHEVKLDRYQASTPGSVLHLGTAESQGNERLHITLSDGWQGLSVRAVFLPCKVSQMVPEGGIVSVPWEATKEPLTETKGRVVFRGLSEDGRVMNSLDLHYTVEGHSPTRDREENKYTPGAVDQIIAETKADAEAADRSARAAAASASSAAASQGAAAQSAATAAEKASQAASSEAAAKAHAEKALSSQTEAAKSEAAAQIAQTAASNSAQAAQAAQKGAEAALQQVGQTVEQELQAAKDSGEFDGPQGPQGEQGPAGPEGPQGKQGPVGPQGEHGNVMFATFSIDPADGTLSMTTPDEYAGPDFAINNGFLEVSINA